MASWRDTTPQHVQDDLDGMLGVALDAAQTFLTKNGEFYPFGLTIDRDGETSLAAGYTGDEHPDSQSVLDALAAGFLHNRDGYRAVASVADVRANGGDAVRVEAEHRDGGPAITLLMPYVRKGLVKKSVNYGQPSASQAERRYWT